MAESSPAAAVCPPHHWLITQHGDVAATQLWICRRCATQKEVSAVDMEQAGRPAPHSWGAGRPPRRGPASTPDKG